MKCIPPINPTNIEKLGFTWVYLFFLFLIQNIDYGYLLEPPHQGGSNTYPQCMFSAKIFKKSNLFQGNFHFFTSEKNLCILYGQVFVMWLSVDYGIVNNNVSL